MRIRAHVGRAFAMLFAAAVPAGLATAAPVNFGGHAYDVIGDDAISWPDARAAATAAGGSLAVIESASEQAFIESLLGDSNATSGSYWFGLQEFDEGEYRPLSGSSTYTNFSTGEPNNGVGVDESVGGLYWSASSSDSTFARRGTWNDLPPDGFPLGAGPSPLPDLPRAGYLIEFNTPIDSPGGGNGGGDGDGGGNGNGGGDGGGGGGNPIPIPAAALVFPATALLAFGAAKRLKR
jgi:hypothetical protein